MIQIRTEQFEALRRPEIESFERRLYVELERAYPERVAIVGREQTKALIHGGLRTGLDRGLEHEDELTSLVVLMLQLGPRFERSPDRVPALALLEHPRLPGRLKIERIERILTRRTGGRVVVPHTGAPR